jgi:hypothetical protein
LGVVHLAANLARVIEGVVADAEIDIELAVAVIAAALEFSERAGDSNGVRFSDFIVTEIVGRDGLRLKLRLGTGEFGVHGHQDG